jgi:hypothetical protein
MRNPKEVLTEDGYETYRAHLHNLREAVFFFINHADDLALEELDGTFLGSIYSVEAALQDEEDRRVLLGTSSKFEYWGDDD